MENKILFIVPGQPQGKLRARWSPHGTHTPQKTINYETYIKEMFAVRYPDFVPLEGPLYMKITAWQMIPKNTSQKKMKLMVAGILRPAKKPDFDNIAKTVCDALEKLAYKNDNQIVTAVINKYYSTKPRLEIEIFGAQI